MPMIARRSVLAAAAASAAGCAGAAKPVAVDQPAQGADLVSESAMASVCDEAQGVQFTLRLCRYPALGIGWAWAHAQTPAGFFASVDHALACDRAETAETPDGARFADAHGLIALQRQGAPTDPRGVRALAALGAWRTARSPEGQGPIPLRCSLEMRPEMVREGLLPGRVEAFGPVRAELQIGARRWRLAGPGQFHEQRQTTPRFTTPFSFATLWSPSAAVTLLETPDGAGGYLLQAGLLQRTGKARIGPWEGGRRALSLEFPDGEILAGEARLRQAYTIPIYGQAWAGGFVAAELGPTRFLGAVNDWRRPGPV